MDDVFIHTIKDFKLHKEKIIELIYKIPQNSLVENSYHDIFHTDWNLPGNMHREYIKYLNSNKILNNFILDFDTFLNAKSCKIKVEIINIWFQIYRKNNYHAYHTHGECNFTNVMYLNLPDNNIKTEIKGPQDRSIQFEAQEGQIVSFPSYLWHCSPVNKSDSEKIIISFNTNLVTI